MAEDAPPVNPLHRLAPLAARGKGGGVRGDYSTKEEEISGEDGGGGDMDWNLGDDSGASGASTTGDNKSLMEDLDRTLGAVDDSG